MVQCWIHLIKINNFIWKHPPHTRQTPQDGPFTISSDLGFSSVSAVVSHDWILICVISRLFCDWIWKQGLSGWGQLCGEYTSLLALSSILVDKYWISMLVNKGKQMILVSQSNQYSKGIEYFIEYMKFQLFLRLGLLSQHTFSYFLDSFQT